MRTTVVNIRTTKDKDYIRIDRTTQFGNPFRIGEYDFYLKRELTREDSIMLFQKRFGRMIKNYPVFRAAVEKLKGRRLGCWCKPLSCHGDIYVEYLERKEK